MSQQSRPLSYESLKTVIQHMEANLRYLVASRCPAIRKIHKVVPLKINHLKLEGTSFEVNGYEHLFYSKTNHPGSQFQRFDLDRNGAIDNKLYLKEEDIEIRDLENLVPFDDPQPVVYDYNGMGDYMMIRDVGIPIYNNFVCYTLNRGTRRVFYPIGHRIRDALRQHLGNFLIGKYSPRIGCLEIGTTYGVLRIPTGLKVLRFRELKVAGNAVLNAIQPLLDPTCLPLQKLMIKVNRFQEHIFYNPILHDADILHVEVRVDMNILTKLKNRNVHLTAPGISLEEMSTLAQNWVDKPRDIGFKFSVGCSLSLDRVGRRLGAVKGDRYSIKIGEHKELVIYREECEIEEGDDPEEKKWMLVMEVVSSGR